MLTVQVDGNFPSLTDFSSICFGKIGCETAFKKTAKGFESVNLTVLSSTFSTLKGLPSTVKTSLAEDGMFGL